MKISLATLLTFVTLNGPSAIQAAEKHHSHHHHDAENNGKLRGTNGRGLFEEAERGLDEGDDTPPIVFGNKDGTFVCEWDKSTKKPIKALTALGNRPYADGSTVEDKTPEVWTGDYPEEGNKVKVDGKTVYQTNAKGDDGEFVYFLAYEADDGQYKNVDPVYGGLSGKKGCDITQKGGPSGDPHFHMFAAKHFEFMGGCDLVLLDNPSFNNGQGITVHIRTVIKTWYSYIENAVIKIGNDTLEVKNGFEKKEFWVNGKAGDKKLVSKGGLLPFTIGGFHVRFRVPMDNVFQFKIVLNDGQEIVIRSVKDFLRVDFSHANGESFSGSRGLMGDFGDDRMVARDGATVFEDPDDFGREWQVLSTEPMLFNKPEGVQHPESCAMPNKELTEVRKRRRLGEGPVSREAAVNACAIAQPEELEDCVADLMATGDLGYALAYGAFYTF